MGKTVLYRDLTASRVCERKGNVMIRQDRKNTIERHLAKLENPSEAFSHFYYWFFSTEKDAVFARTRCDVPYTLLTNLAGREREVAKQMVYDALAGCPVDTCFYLNVVRALEDRCAVPALKQALEKANRENNSLQKKACLETLYVLTNNPWYGMHGWLIRPRG